MNPKYLSRPLKLLLLLLPTLLFVLLWPVQDSADTRRVRDFYREDPNSLDVVVLGASEVFTGFSPALAYGEYGFTSYPMGTSGNYMELFPLQLEEIYRTQQPKLVVVELTSVLLDKEPHGSDAVFRTYISQVPLCANKIRAIRQFGEAEEQLSYYLPFMLHHGTHTILSNVSMVRNQLSALLRGRSFLKGVSTCTTADFSGEVLDLTREERLAREALPELAEGKLRAFLTWCRENGYDNLVFTCFPHRIDQDVVLTRMRWANAAGDIVREYGYDFLNTETISADIGIDPEADFYNGDHMNIHGQQKFTRYLSEILTEQYGIGESELPAPVRKKWDESYESIRRYYAYTEKLCREQPGVEYWLWEEWWEMRDMAQVEPQPARR